MTLRSDLEEAVLDREREPWTRRRITHPQYEALAGGGIDRYKRVYLAEQHITIMDTKTRLILWPHFPVPAGELAREYLRQMYEGAGIEPRSSSYFSPRWEALAPLHCSPVRHRKLAYVDIRHAYWELAQPFGPDVLLGKGNQKVFPGRVGWWVPSEVAEDRPLRHNIMGTIFSRGMMWYRYGELRTNRYTGGYANPSLYLLVMASLHAIALAAVRRYEVAAWLTDAAIVPIGQAEDLVGWLRETWGLSSRVVAEGIGTVWNVSEYIVGSKRTWNIVNGNATHRAEEYHNLRRHLSAPMLREWRATPLVLKDRINALVR